MRNFNSTPDITHSAEPAPVRQLSLNGVPALGSLEESDEIFLDGDDIPIPAPAPPVPIPNPPPPPSPAKPEEAKRGAPVCPTSIKVQTVGNLLMDESFAKAGWLTGWGGFAAMEVSDSSGKTWDGTAIHEKLKNVKNTCGTNKACSNASGEGGAAGSTFKVGEGGNFLGIFKLPQKKNTFYDQHIIGLKGVSLLHKTGKQSCEIQCEQVYDCGGKHFGSTFLITYSMTRDTIKSGNNSYNVTRVNMNKTVKP
jgi:hypothetical protein